MYQNLPHPPIIQYTKEILLEHPELYCIAPAVAVAILAGAAWAFIKGVDDLIKRTDQLQQEKYKRDQLNKRAQIITGFTGKIIHRN